MNDTGRYVDDYREFLKLPVKIDQPGGMEFDKKELEEIRFDYVSFRYPGTKEYILEDISFTLDAHRTVSIVGENGAGKTTFIKLLMRLYEPTSGVIYFNGINIQDIAYTSYIRLFAPVFQDYQVYAFPVVAMADEDDLAVVVFPVYCQNLPEPVKRFLKEFLRNIPYCLPPAEKSLGETFFMRCKSLSGERCLPPPVYTNRPYFFERDSRI